MIEIKRLEAFYGERKVLTDINATFPDGRMTVIIGPNGSGKSTLLKSILSLIPRTNGKIEVDGKDIKAMSLNEIARSISYLSQSRNVPSITSERMVLHGRFPYLGWPRKYREDDRKIVKESMIRTGCESLASRMMTDLSGGERQKVYLAMALAQDTKTIFMDEPTTYLDPENQLSMMESALSLRNEGKSVVMVLHDLPLAMRNADSILVMDKGRIVMSGTPDEIWKSGILESVFRIRLDRTETETGYHYMMDSRKGE